MRPQSLVFTLFGDYVCPAGGRIWAGNLIGLLGHFGVSLQAARSAIARMKRNGFLCADRVGTYSFYSLTPKSARIIEEGTARIFNFPNRDGSWDGNWHLVSYSVPEDERDMRDRLRRELEWMGFGMLTPGLWISPYNHCAEIASIADSLGVRGRIELFTAQHVGFSDPQTIASRCWALPALNARYASFIKKYKPMYYADCPPLTQGTDYDPRKAFVRRFTLIHEYRRFPYCDPQLPTELLPSDWHGTEAAVLFHQYHHLLAQKANAFFHSACDHPRVNHTRLSRAESRKAETLRRVQK